MNFNDALLGDFFVLDSETTTKYTNRSEPIELGIINQDGKTVFHSLLKPIFRIDKPAIDVHGIHMGKVKHAPLFIDVYPELKSLLENKNVFIYNATFDNRVIKNSCTFYKVPPIEYRSYCVMREYRKMTGEKKNVKLEIASGIKTRHSVIEDCRDTLRVLRQMQGKEFVVNRNKSSHEITADYFLSGVGISEIAKERSLAVSTIEGHLLRAYHQGLPIDLDSFIQKEYEDEIVNVVNVHGLQPLKKIKEYVSENISYTDIRAVLLKHKNVFVS